MPRSACSDAWVERPWLAVAFSSTSFTEELNCVRELAVVSVAPPSPDDSFDAIVQEMRAKKSKELIGELYRQLFSLDQWCFLCEPGDERAPVQWEFPEGINPTPALLAFTSSERAASAAAALGLYPEGSSVSIMPVSVKDAVEWISSSDCANEWLCFNLTQQEFPLYCDAAVELLENT